MPAMTASLRTWRKTVYLDKVHPIPAALVFNHRAEHPKRSVVNAFGEVMFTGHTLYVQVFHTDGTHLAVVSQSVDYFVKVIFPLISNTLVQACYLSPDFLPIGRTFCLPVQGFLQMFMVLKHPYPIFTENPSKIHQLYFPLGFVC